MSSGGDGPKKVEAVRESSIETPSEDSKTSGVGTEPSSQADLKEKPEASSTPKVEDAAAVGAESPATEGTKSESAQSLESTEEYVPSTIEVGAEDVPVEEIPLPADPSKHTREGKDRRNIPESTTRSVPEAHATSSEHVKRIPKNPRGDLDLSPLLEPYLFYDESVQPHHVSIAPTVKPHNASHCDPTFAVQGGAFQITVDASRFDRQDININVLGSKLNVYAKHELETVNGYEGYTMHQIFHIPHGVDKSQFAAAIERGKLVLSAPLSVPSKV